MLGGFLSGGELEAHTVGERILEFLDQLPVDELTTRDTWPADATQDGIAAAVGISRAHVALEMKRLMGKRLVEGLHAHVNGNGARRKVYRAIDERRYAVFTEQGERIPLVHAVARDIRVVYLRCPSCGKESRVAIDD